MPIAYTLRRGVAKTAAYTIKKDQPDKSGTRFTNRSAGGSVTFTLPSPAGIDGCWYEFHVVADQSLIVSSTGKIVAAGNAAADNVGFQVASAKIGGRIIAISDGTSWICHGSRAGGGFCVNGTEVAPSIGGTALTATAAEINVLHGVTAGTAFASGAVVLDANKAVDGALLGKTTTQKIGAGSVAMTIAGTLGASFSAAGVGNAADTTDDTLQTVTVKANSLDANGKFIAWEAFGKTGATANNKQVKVIWGATTIVATGVITSNAKSWSAWGYIARTSAGNQICFGAIYVDTAVSAQATVAATADETTDVALKTTGASGTTGAANDVLGMGLVVSASN